MNRRPTYWIDLTDLYLWTGHHTGIQRVVYNVARFYAQRDDAKFFVYNERQREFSEISFSVIKPPQKVVVTPTRRSEMRDQLKYQLKTAYFYLPLSWRKVLTPRLKPVARRAYHRTHHLIHITREAFNKPVKITEAERADFRMGDAVIILGAGWIRPSIVTELWRRKQTAGFKVIHFVHDMIPTYHPHLFGPGHFELATKYMFEAISASDSIITNSEASRGDIERFTRELNLPDLPIEVIRLGDELHDLAEPERPNARIEPQQYLLVVGTIEVRKNHMLLYNAYKLAKARGLTLPKLVIVGRPGWNAGDMMYALKNDPDVNRSILVLSDTSDAELVWLYQNCLFTVYPATYEGWGLPVAESLVYGKLSLTSNTSSMPEIAGDMIDYFQPFDSAGCLETIAKYLDPAVLAKTEAGIKKGYKSQSWQATYAEFDQAATRQLAALSAASPAPRQ